MSDDIEQLTIELEAAQNLADSFEKLYIHAAAEADRLGDELAIAEHQVTEWQDAYAFTARILASHVCDTKDPPTF